MFKSLNDAQKWIESVEKFGQKYDLKRMITACEMLGHPEKSFKSIHIGGTNGKGSTLTFLKEMLRAEGYQVGTYTSPYLVHFNERITLNDKYISDEDFLFYINKIYTFQKHYLTLYNDQITFFELLTLIAFLYFQKQQPDIVLIEVGLGGTLDATNVITPVLSIITTIGYDHQEVLGNSLESIALNKLGIVKEGIPLVTGIEQIALLPLFISYTNKKQSPFHHVALNDYKILDFSVPTKFSYLSETYCINMASEYQVKNAVCALLAARVLNDTTPYNISVDSQKTGVKRAFWPGRFEIIGSVILDGAHNLPGLQATLETVRNYYRNHEIRVVFTVMKDKQYEPMIQLLDQYADQLCFTEIPYPRCASAELLYTLSNHPKKSMNNNFLAAFNHLLPKSPQSILLITGSLYFISMIRPTVMAHKNTV